MQCYFQKKKNNNKNRTTNVDNVMKFLQTGVYKVLKVIFLFHLSLVRLQTGPCVQAWVLGFKKDEGNWRESKRRQSK